MFTVVVFKSDIERIKITMLHMGTRFRFQLNKFLTR